MKIQERTQDGILIFELAGKIMGGDPATLFRGKVTEALESGQRKFVIDLEQVDWMNSIGLGMLVAILNTITNHGGKLKLSNIGKIEKVLLITKLVTIFDIHDSTPKAVASFK